MDNECCGNCVYYKPSANSLMHGKCRVDYNVDNYTKRCSHCNRYRNNKTKYMTSFDSSEEVVNDPEN